MLTVIGTLIPIAIGVALSTVPITAAIILLSAQRAAAAPFYLAGWIAGMFTVALAFSLGLTAIPDDADAATDLAAGLAEVVAGIVMAGFGLLGLLHRRVRTTINSPNRWVARVERLRPISALVLALALNLRPKALILGAAAGLTVAGHFESASAAVIELAIYTIIGSSSVAVPVVMTLLRPQMMRPKLHAANVWIAKNRAIVTAIVLLLVGSIVFGDGLVRLDGL